jgi:hypothetical protein
MRRKKVFYPTPQPVTHRPRVSVTTDVVLGFRYEAVEDHGTPRFEVSTDVSLDGYLPRNYHWR